jgi:type IV secretory pathway TraG/TraD family ATPase VirD4
MRLGIFEAMDQEEGDQRLWFVVDELDALGAIDGLKDALARLRKFGGRCILGFQSIAQVSGTYGKGVAETIVENCANTLILRCSASERGGTSEFASKLIGQREVIRTTHSRSRKSSGWNDSTTTSSEQLRVESAVMASEIERLPDLSGYLKLASVPDWFSVALTPMSGEAKPRPRRPASVSTPPIQPSPPSQPTPVAATPDPASFRPSAPESTASVSTRTDVPAPRAKTHQRKRQAIPLGPKPKPKRASKPKVKDVPPTGSIEMKGPTSGEVPPSS